MKVDYLECTCSLFANDSPMSTPSVKQLEAFWWAATCRLQNQLRMGEQRLDDGELDFAVIAGRSSRSSLLSRPV